MLPDRIKTQRLLLRPFLVQDAAEVLAYAGDLDYARYQSGPWPFRRHEAEAFVAELVSRDRTVRPSWAITRDGVVSGIVVLSFDPGYTTAWLGYGLGRALWGKGFAREAVSAALAPAFGEVAQLERVGARTDSRNVRSRRLLQKLGFLPEATAPPSEFVRGERVHPVVYRLFRQEWNVGTGHGELRLTA
jgi:RimJ/RimL family protein N-acetyltransferase